MPDDTSANDNVSPARPEPTAFVPTPFDEVIDISDLVAERRRLQRNLWAMRIITIVLLIAAIAVACFPLALQFESDRNLAATTATTAKEVAGWPYPQAKDKLTAARAYNKKLAESGQPILGEAVDPFSAAQGGSQASGEDSASKKDKEYQSLLNTGNGVMGAIKVPKQSINLPIYHGTSEVLVPATCTARRCRWEVNPPIRSLPGTAWQFRCRPPSRMTCLTRAISPLVLVWAYWRQDCPLSGWHDGTRPRASSATAHSGRGCAARAKAPMIRWPRPHADRPAPCPA